MGAQRQADSAVIRPDGGAPVPTTVRRTGLAIAYLAAIAAAAAALVALVPNYVVEPMPGMTHVMALIGGANDSHPWLYLLGLGAMIPAYGLLIPFLVAFLTYTLTGRGPRPRPWMPKAAVLAMVPLTVGFAAYLAAHLAGPLILGGESHGYDDSAAVLLFVVTPLPLAVAAYRTLRDGAVDAWSAWAIYAGAAVLHAAMFAAMFAPDLFGGGGTHGHVEALVLVRWHL
jgi:hypothetical protein